MKRIIKNLMLVLAVFMCMNICMPQIITQAASKQEETDTPITGQTEGQSFRLKKSSTEDNDVLFEEYVEGSDEQGHAPRVKKTAGNKLSGIDKTIYTRLMQYISQVAAGEQASTVFEINVEDLGLEQLGYTAGELGVDSIVVDGAISDEAVKALKTKGSYDLTRIIQALLADNPYGLYWYDKTLSTTAKGYSYRASYDYGKREYVLSFTGSINFYFPVAAEYAAGSYMVDTEIGQSVQTIVETAKAIVSKYANSSDYDKLHGYREEICSLVSYNNDAVAENVSYGNPWQLIWVFDDDSSTNVVCEGYAKAFQYLCNLTDFDEKIDCITVTGSMSGGTGAGAHMWNIITMEDGKNYLVDVTNCDDGTIGEKNQLFLAAYTTGNISGGYSFICSHSGGSVSENILYIYDQKTLQFYESSELEIIKKDEGSCINSGSGHSWDDGQITSKAGCDKAGEKTYSCKNCSATKTEEIAALGHQYKEEITEASCTKGGYTTHICERCGDSYVDSYTDSRGHTPGEAVHENEIQATCEKAGSYDEVVYCELCQEELSRESKVIKATGHNWSEWKTTKEASETEEGEETRTCQNDPSHVETRSIPVLTHVHELQKVDKKDSTCKEEGNIEYYRCSKCGKLYSDEAGKKEISLEETVIAKTAHIWDDGVITKEPEGDMTGEKTYTCTVCGQTRTEEVPAQTKAEADQEKAESDIAEKNKPVLISGIRLTGISHNIAAGKKIQLTASIYPKNATNKKLKWTSFNTKVAVVNQNGCVSVKAKTGGKTVIIKAEACDGSGKFFTWKIKSMKGVVKSLKISGKKKVKAGKAVKLKAKIKATKGANKKLKWTSNNTKYATVNGSGKVFTKKAGKGKSVKITAMATDGSGRNKTVTIKIK